MTTENQLLPCPFCGAQPEQCDFVGNHNFVSCPSCGIDGPDGGYGRGRSGAIAAWNARAALAQPADGGEPVRWALTVGGDMRHTIGIFDTIEAAQRELIVQGGAEFRHLYGIVPLYTAPPASKPADGGEVVGWLIDWPDEPELGDYFAHEPSETGRSRPLYTTPPASQEQAGAVAALDAKIDSVRRANTGRGGRINSAVAFGIGLLEDVRDQIKAASQEQAQQPNEWREMIQERFDVNHSAMPSDPREAVLKLIRDEVAMALDPACSSQAEALIQRGRDEAQKPQFIDVCVKVQGGDTHAAQGEWMGEDIGYLVCVPREWQPQAQAQEVGLTDGLIERGAMTGIVDAQIDAIIAALRAKGGK